MLPRIPAIPDELENQIRAPANAAYLFAALLLLVASFAGLFAMGVRVLVPILRTRGGDVVVLRLASR